MNIKLILITIIATIVITSCDDSTDNIGTSLNNLNQINIETKSFNVKSNSFAVDSILSNSPIGHLGKVKDPETGDYITSECMIQFTTIDTSRFPEISKIASLESKEVVADSCDIILSYTDFYGDTLAPMKASAYELEKPMIENRNYYSNFNPDNSGYIRKDGIKADVAYKIGDLVTNNNTKEKNKDNTKSIVIKLNKKYKDKNGIEYNNYGTYIMRKYFMNPSLFKKPISFIKNVVPGFFIKHKSGLGSMVYIKRSVLVVYFNYHDKTKTNKDTIVTGATTFNGTEEVLQTTTISHDKSLIQRLINEKSMTYIKTPSGIYTEMTLPIDDIYKTHENDTINTARVVIPRINNEKKSGYSFPTSKTLLLIPKDSLRTFFLKNNVINNKWSYYTTFLDNKNEYTFNNISYLISLMKRNKRKSDDWNKVVIVPIDITTNSAGKIIKVSHDMKLTTTKLVGGDKNPYKPIKINVIYSKLK